MLLECFLVYSCVSSLIGLIDQDFFLSFLIYGYKFIINKKMIAQGKGDWLCLLTVLFIAKNTLLEFEFEFLKITCMYK